MAKGRLFALVRKGSKLNYLDDGNNQSDQHERKHSNEKLKSCFKVNSQGDRVIEHKTNEVSSKPSQQLQTVAGKAESKRRRKKLFDLTLQKLSKGGKTHHSSPGCMSNDISTEGAFRVSKQRDLPRPDHFTKAMLVPSVASGYFVHEISNNNHKELTSKTQENGSLMPSIVLTDHDVGNVMTRKTVETNMLRVQYSRYSSIQLRVDERRKRPSSWTGGESSPRDEFSSLTNRRGPRMSGEAEQSDISGLCVEAIPISTSPSTLQRNLGRQLNTSDSIVDRRERVDSLLSVETTDRFVKRASSWSQGDAKSFDRTDKMQSARKINIFLPTA